MFLAIADQKLYPEHTDRQTDGQTHRKTSLQMCLLGTAYNE